MTVAYLTSLPVARIGTSDLRPLLVGQVTIKQHFFWFSFAVVSKPNPNHVSFSCYLLCRSVVFYFYSCLLLSFNADNLSIYKYANLCITRSDRTKCRGLHTHESKHRRLLARYVSINRLKFTYIHV